MSSALKTGRLLSEPYHVGGRPERLVTQHELDAILEHETGKAFERGFAQGSAKGYELGEREGAQRAAEEVAGRLKKEFEDKMAVLDGLIGAVSAAREQLLRGAEREVAGLVLTIACRVLAREVETSSVTPELVAEAVRQSMDRKHVVVRVNPADRETLSAGGRPLDAALSGAAGVEFVDDPTVGRCGCLVESNMGIVDAQLDKQIEQLRQALLG
ncbi:MAG: hypothetical protein JW889_01930 [Verrucomicrobia bacterium]|nr:hypothetical protein [Verrucomicrobiota bacterium]